MGSSAPAARPTPSGRGPAPQAWRPVAHPTRGVGTPAVTRPSTDTAQPLSTLSCMSRDSGADGRFQSEADMLAPLARQAQQLLAGSKVLFEVPSTAGIPDLTLVSPDSTAIDARAGRAALLESIDVKVMLALKQFPGYSVDIDELSSACQVSAGYLRRSVLPRLIDGLHLEKDERRWRSLYKWQSLAKRIVTIEAKKQDWRRGIAQASRHTAVADEAWLVLDSRSSKAARQRTDWFSLYGVGLGLISVNEEWTTVVPPGINRSRQPQRELLVERAMGLYLKGSASGPIPRVFGTVLVASTELDPRLVDAVAH